MNDKPQEKSPSYDPLREKRVADALRENLRKRKEQQAQRTEGNKE